MAEYFDRAQRLWRLADRFEPQFRNRFRQVVTLIRDELDLRTLERLITAGRVEEAFVRAELAAMRLGNLWGDIYIATAEDTAAFVGGSLNVTLDFNRVNVRAVNAVQQNSFRLVQGFVQEQRQVAQQAIANGVQQGLNPRQQAVAFRDSVGLTPYQQQIVENYRNKLRQGNTSALGNDLRDRRFDSRVRSAASGGRPLSEAEIDRMVSRYRERWVKFRSETIARTEALDAIHEGNREMYQQAVENGTLDAEEIFRQWEDSGDGRVRDTHQAMDGQRRGLNEPFTSPSGAQLMRPLDPNAPPEERIKCRCAVLTRFTDSAKQRTLTQLRALGE